MKIHGDFFGLNVEVPRVMATAASSGASPYHLDVIETSLRSLAYCLPALTVRQGMCNLSS